MEAFQRRPNETYASVNWLERLNEPDRRTSIVALRRVLAAKIDLGASGKLAVLSVAAISRLDELQARHKPEEADDSHAGICGYPEDREDDLDVALELSMLIDEVFPARG